MNLVLAILLVGFARLALVFGSEVIVDLLLNMAALSLVLCFFNLIPIPPLDGSHVLRNLTGMSYETYFKFAQFGSSPSSSSCKFPRVRDGLSIMVHLTLGVIMLGFGFR
ncbi:MAG: site-2 protease family protein [Limisphaerales bacterium]